MPAAPVSTGAPTTTVSPEIATEVPNSSSAAASEAVQLLLLAPDSAATHKDIGRALIGPAAPSVIRRADHDRLPAEIATELPKKSAAAASEARQLLLLAPDSAAAHKDIGRALTGARGAIITGAPTTTVSPLIATEKPNRSPAAASEAASFCCWLQTPPLRTKT